MFINRDHITFDRLQGLTGIADELDTFSYLDGGVADQILDRSCPRRWCSFGNRRAFRTEPGMDQLAAGRLMRGSSLIVAMVSSVM